MTDLRQLGAVNPEQEMLLSGRQAGTGARMYTNVHLPPPPDPYAGTGGVDVAALSPHPGLAEESRRKLQPDPRVYYETLDQLKANLIRTPDYPSEVDNQRVGFATQLLDEGIRSFVNAGKPPDLTRLYAKITREIPAMEKTLVDFMNDTKISDKYKKKAAKNFYNETGYYPESVPEAYREK